MMDPEQQRRFVELRARGFSFDKIAAELDVSRRTLITWSRKLQFEIQNERALELERIQYESGANPEDRARAAAAELERILSVLRTRDVSKLSTSRLYSLADTLRRRIAQETGSVKFALLQGELSKAQRAPEVVWKA